MMFISLDSDTLEVSPQENLFTDCLTECYILCEVYGCWNPQLTQKETGNLTTCTNGFQIFTDN